MQYVNEAKMKDVRMLVLGGYGVITGSHVSVIAGYGASAPCSSRDRAIMKVLRAVHFPVAVISQNDDLCLRSCCAWLGADYYTESRVDEGSITVFERIVERSGIPLNAIAYLGANWEDMPLLEKVGLPLMVADADPVLRTVCAARTRAKGGDHAVMEVGRIILSLYEEMMFISAWMNQIASMTHILASHKNGVAV